ncbi:MAG: iron-sulfur cluster repair di-iron protein [Terriglobales bacterium]
MVRAKLEAEDDMNTTLSPSRSLGELATEIPGAAGVFERVGLDFCCGGKQTLRQACASKGLDELEVLDALDFSQALPAATDAHWRTEPLQALMKYIVEQHHAYVRRELPSLERWLEKTIAAHGQRRPELLTLRHSFEAMSSELSQHMAKEELILFPAISRLASPDAGTRPAAQCFQTLAQPVAMMLAEHEHSGRDLAEMRSATGDYVPPPDACATFRALYHGLEAFERDLRQHVHLENNILFPRALELEQQHAARD